MTFKGHPRSSGMTQFEKAFMISYFIVILPYLYRLQDRERYRQEIVNYPRSAGNSWPD